MNLLNDQNLIAKINLYGTITTVDLSLDLPNLTYAVKLFLVDSDQKGPPHSIKNRKMRKPLVDEFSDHMDKETKLEMEVLSLINFGNKEGWTNYPAITNR